ncbi:hypothetical protein [Janthinobacterium sp.]|uniref:hypothetical protein n=1 Tax=Janthinobacterium sp. TaxID=1871054 RepID=UPI00262CD84B|nr:hypothetical protein [Janthinobacterium sp.]
METAPGNIWYLPGPMFQYNEDVKALARQAGLKIIDANVAVDRANAAEDVPEVTIKAEYLAQGTKENGERAAELQAVYEQLLERERALDEREQRLAETEQRIEALGAANEQAAARNAEQAAANEAEAQRLRDEAAKQAAAALASAPKSKPGKADQA